MSWKKYLYEQAGIDVDEPLDVDEDVDYFRKNLMASLKIPEGMLVEDDPVQAVARMDRTARGIAFPGMLTEQMPMPSLPMLTETMPVTISGECRVCHKYRGHTEWCPGSAKRALIGSMGLMINEEQMERALRSSGSNMPVDMLTEQWLSTL